MANLAFFAKKCSKILLSILAGQRQEAHRADPGGQLLGGGDVRRREPVPVRPLQRTAGRRQVDADPRGARAPHVHAHAVQVRPGGVQEEQGLHRCRLRAPDTAAGVAGESPLFIDYQYP